MFIEMAFIQKFLLLLFNLLYAVAVVLCAFLIFAGLGSLSCRRLELVIGGVVRKPPRRRYSVTFVIGMVSLMAIVSIGLIAPLAFFMGMPFPLGLDDASVVSTILATCLAIAFGFNVVILLAIGIYLVGGWTSPR